MNLWVVGSIRNYAEGQPIQWQLEGVFDSEERAVAECVDESHFVGPTELNNRHPLDSTEWPGAYYPKLESRPTGQTQ